MVSRTWVFTINNYSEKDIEWLKTQEVKTMTVSKEVGESGTPHLQGFVTWKRTYRLSALKKLHSGAHWEIAKTCDGANYCRKIDSDVIIEIDNRVQGQRTDISRSWDAALAGTDKKTFAMNKPNWQEWRVFEIGRELFVKPRNFKPEVTWIWGETGSGKTRSVVEKEPNLWMSGRNLKWWMNYENQEATLFDDFRGDFCTFHELLRIFDRYEYIVEVKGGQRQLNSKRMYVTSCYPPDRIYQTREDINQLLRRIDNIIRLDL